MCRVLKENAWNSCKDFSSDPVIKAAYVEIRGLVPSKYAYSKAAHLEVLMEPMGGKIYRAHQCEPSYLTWNKIDGLNKEEFEPLPETVLNDIRAFSTSCNAALQTVVCLKNGTGGCGDPRWSDKGDIEISWDRAQRGIKRAFVNNMANGTGRAGLQVWLQKLVDILNLTLIDVMNIGHSSKNDATGRKISFKFFDRGDGEDSSLSDNSPLKSSPARSSSPSSESNTDVIKTFVPDIVLYLDTGRAGGFVKIFLIASLKKGSKLIDVEKKEFVLELVSHMTYQNEVYGIQICAMQAEVIHVKRTTDEILISKIAEYNFREGVNFNIDSFTACTKLLGQIILKMNVSKVTYVPYKQMKNSPKRMK
ncbi:uncharacterized protein LOC135485734 isoform X2 [Lineus longissimus]|uniref:uncharacterized protein LOC135485734 isoform X2 n=1 Tax=Lineus longissimus TaxID=88925 RepID=UPI002B4E6E49